MGSYIASLIFLAIGTFDVCIAVKDFIDGKYISGTVMSMIGLWFILHMIKAIFET